MMYLSWPILTTKQLNFETLIHIGCKNADGLSLENEIVDDDILTFFGTQAINARALTNLELGNPFTSFDYNSQFYVNKWDVNSSTKFTQNEWHNQNLLASPVTPISLTLSNGKVINLTEEEGFAGQGNLDPRSEFENHAIVKYNGKYYNPSYGSAIASSKNSWETPALSCFGSLVIYKSSSGIY